MTYRSPNPKSFFAAVAVGIAVYFLVEVAATAAAVWVMKLLGVI